MSYLKKVKDKGLITINQKFVVDQLQYECIMGSAAYGVANTDSDLDIYGFCIPNKDMIFPHLKGEILGFGDQIQRFEQFQCHHVIDKETGKEYDFSIFSIVKFFQLCMENNPNFLEMIHTPRNLITHSTKVGEMVRENRNQFLSKRCWNKMKSYAFSQMHKMKNKNPLPGSKRYKDVQANGMDTKYLYHLVRLLSQAEQILIEHDLDLQRSKEKLKAIRRGEWEPDDIEKYFMSREQELEKVYLNSTLRVKPDEKVIKQLLIDCLEEHFGSLGDCVVIQNQTELIINELEEIVNKYRTC